MCVTILKNMVSTAEIHEVYVFLFFSLKLKLNLALCSTVVSENTRACAAKHLSFSSLLEKSNETLQASDPMLYDKFVLGYIAICSHMVNCFPSSDLLSTSSFLDLNPFSDEWCLIIPVLRQT